jgi:nitroreductase
METRDVIRARRNVRDYEDRSISADDLDWILEAARLTPSSQNRQRWEFVAVTDRGHLERLAEAAGGSRHVSTSAATIALVAPDADSPGARESIR